MSSLKAGTSTPLPWNDVQSSDLSPFTADAAATVTQTPGANTQGYQPVMALAQNHVHFLGVPGVAAGNAKIFVIHCEYMHTDLCLLSWKRDANDLDSLIYATRPSIIRLPALPSHTRQDRILFHARRIGRATRVCIYP